MSSYYVHIRNPKSLYMKYWYLKRRYHCEWLYDIPTNNSLEMFLSKDEERRTELFLRFEAIDDLFHYIVVAEHSRCFIFQLLENNNDRNYFGILNRNDTWWLIQYERIGNEVSIIRNQIKKKLTYRRLYNMVNFSYPVDVIGFRLLERIRM